MISFSSRRRTLLQCFQYCNAQAQEAFSFLRLLFIPPSGFPFFPPQSAIHMIRWEHLYHCVRPPLLSLTTHTILNY